MANKVTKMAAVSAVLVIAVSAYVGLVELRLYRLQQATQLLSYCSGGRTQAGCEAHLGKPSDSWMSGDAQVELWKSTADRPSDIAVVSRNAVIVEVLDIDRPTDRDRFQDKYK